MKTEENASGPIRSIAPFWRDLPRSLFGPLEDEFGVLLPSHQQVAMVLEVVRIEEHVRPSTEWRGRPSISRKPVARALVAKAVLNIPTTKDLVERLRVDCRLRRICGFTGRVPSEATFSRALETFSASGVLDKNLECRVRALLGTEVFHHVSHDSTAVPGREKTPRKPKPAPQPKVGRGGRRTKGQRPPPTVQELQENRSWQESHAALPTACDYGVKIGPKGYPIHWRGYKGHAGVGDGGIPLAFFTTSASMSDALAAIPSMKMVTDRVGQVFYNLFDRAYQGEPIRRTATALDQVVIVQPKRTKKDQPAPHLTPDRAKRFENRTVVERFFSDLKENHGGNFIFVRGAPKVHTHLMFGVLAIFGLQMLRL